MGARARGLIAGERARFLCIASFLSESGGVGAGASSQAGVGRRRGRKSAQTRGSAGAGERASGRAGWLGRGRTNSREREGVRNLWLRA